MHLPTSTYQVSGNVSADASQLGQRIATALVFFRAALEYTKSLDLLAGSRDMPPPAPACLLGSYAIELALKSYLLGCGKSEQDLKSIGHNLIDAWNQSVTLGLNLDATPPSWIGLLNSGHDKPFPFRYWKTNSFIVTPNIATLAIDVRRVLSVIGAKLRIDEKGNEIPVNC